MPVVTFNNMTDQLAPEQRRRDHYLVQTDSSDNGIWVPYAEGVWLQPCAFNVTAGGMTVLLKGLPGAKLGVHYHVGTVRGYTLKGRWHYLEHDWVAGPGAFIYEPAGEAHTLVIAEDSPEPALILFMIEGGLIYLDKTPDGNFVAMEDAFSALELCRAHYRSVGLDPATLDALIR